MEHNSTNIKKSSNLSSRIEVEMYEKLVEGAKGKGISLNSFVNSIMKRYMEWDQYSEEMRLIPITKRTLKKIFRTMDDATIKKISRDVGDTVPQELIYLSYDRFDFKNLMKMVELSDSRFGKVKCVTTDSTCNINIVHGVCENFSKFLAETH